MTKISLRNTAIPTNNCILIADIVGCSQIQPGDTLYVNINQIDSIRHSFKFGTWITVTKNRDLFELQIDLNHHFSDGIYYINSIKIQGSMGDIELLDRSEPYGGWLFFRVSADPAVNPITLDEIRMLEKKSNEILFQPFHTEKSRSESDPEFSVLVFCAPALIHNAINLAGYSIFPLPEGLSNLSAREAVSAFLQQTAEWDDLPPDPDGVRTFQAAHPGVAILYRKIRAIDKDDAIALALRHAQLVCITLAMEQQGQPQVFSLILYEEERWHIIFFYSGYRGNIAPPLLGENIPLALEYNIPLFQASPWLQMLAQYIADAAAEDRMTLKYLRYWTVLEEIARTRIESDSMVIRMGDGTPILCRGKPQTSKHVKSKVYLIISNNIDTCLFDYCDIYNNHIVVTNSPNDKHSPDAEVISLWDTLEAVYCIRNAVAHTGAFRPDLDKNLVASPGGQIAIRFFGRHNDFLLSFVKDCAQAALNSEMRAAHSNTTNRK